MSSDKDFTFKSYLNQFCIYKEDIINNPSFIFKITFRTYEIIFLIGYTFEIVVFAYLSKLAMRRK